MTATERKFDFELTIDTPQMALKGEIWSDYYENFENKMTALQRQCTVHHLDVL